MIRTKQYYFFSRAIAGHEDKLWSIMLGSRDSGKGIACDAILTAFDKYIAIFNADSLMFDKIVVMQLKHYHGISF